MPRAPSSAKRQQAAGNHHNRDGNSNGSSGSGNGGSRHENGLVGPGKRVSRHKSQSQSHADVSNARQQQLAPASAPAPAAADANNARLGPSSRSQQPVSSTTNGAATLPTRHDDMAVGSARFNAAPGAAGSAEYNKSSSAAMSIHGRPLALGNDSEASASADSLAVGAGTPTAAGMPNGNANPNPGVNPEENVRRIDVNAAKNVNVHRDPGPLEFAYTVLRSCPLYDTIAILIVLMQLSPVALSLIYGLFTLLTFVPPVTTSSGLGITDMFEAAIGTPSITVLLCIDCVFLMVWIFLPGLLQSYLLDFAKVTIAMTLGGSGSSRPSSLNTFILCSMVVSVSHFGQYPGLQHLSRVSTLIGGDRWPSGDQGDPLESSAAARRRDGTYAWIRNVLAVHIVMQGLVKWVREWYLRREKRDAQPQSQADPEAGKTLFPGEAAVEGGSGTADADTSGNAGVGGGSASTGGAVGSGPGGVSGAQLPTSSSSAAVSTKKKRKQSAQVRIRQPLWAALASTKIVMVKEYELSHAARESAGSNATDIHNLGNAPFNTQPAQIWICYVGSDEICFATSHFPDEAPEDGPRQESGRAAAPSWYDGSKPFYVRVNNAVWQPTRILRAEPERDGPEGDMRLQQRVLDVEEAEEGQGEDGEGRDGGAQRHGHQHHSRPAGSRWTGDIYGLTPMSSYECEFVSTRTNEVIFSTSVRTTQARTRDGDAGVAGAAGSHQLAAAAAAAHRAQARKDPATTLKTSIGNQEAKLLEEKAKIKALRKENNRRVNQLRKEIDKLTNAVQSSGGNDDKWRQKISQHGTQQQQAEQSIRDLDEEIRELATVPEELQARFRARQTAWNDEKVRFDGARASFKSFKGTLDSDLKTQAAERDGLKNRRNKIAARTAKLDDEHARITDANSRGLGEAERRRQQRALFQAEVERIEHSFLNRIDFIKEYNSSKAHQAQAMAAGLQAYFDSFSTDVGFTPAVVAGPENSVPASIVGAAAGAGAGFPPPAGVPWGSVAQPHSSGGLVHGAATGASGGHHFATSAPAASMSAFSGGGGAVPMWPAAASAAPLSQPILSSMPPAGSLHGLNSLSLGSLSASSIPMSMPMSAPFAVPIAAQPSAAAAHSHHYSHMSPLPASSSLAFKQRGRSSSMLSDVTGFTQSSLAEDETGVPTTNAGLSPHHAHDPSSPSSLPTGTAGVVGSPGHHQAHHGAPPPGFYRGPFSARGLHRRGGDAGSGDSLSGSRSRSDSGSGPVSGSGSGSGSGVNSERSSVRSGSGSGGTGSVSGPSSPI